VSRVREGIRLLRPHQWSKNLLVFAPVVAGHRAADVAVLLAASWAFVAMSLAASAGYVVNDALDADADRLDARKRNRPYASGALPTWTAWIVAPLLALAAGGVALRLPWRFGAILAGYVAMSVAYSLGVKRKLVADVLLLAGLYTSRIFAGGFASGILVSEWLATFAMFLFLSLAFLKRASELHGASSQLVGRGYAVEDREAVLAMGTSAGYIATLVMALYISSSGVRLLYPHPDWLWGLCPLVLYWLSRLWIQARRGAIREDPLVYAVRYRATWAVAAAGAAIMALGSR
jgi:4-hydroxybenzoate polyprenyltransferase